MAYQRNDPDTGIVTDTRTGLQWVAGWPGWQPARMPRLRSESGPILANNYGGYDDWRLPTLNELTTLFYGRNLANWPPELCTWEVAAQWIGKTLWYTSPSGFLCLDATRLVGLGPPFIHSLDLAGDFASAPHSMRVLPVRGSYSGGSGLHEVTAWVGLNLCAADGRILNAAVGLPEGHPTRAAKFAAFASYLAPAITVARADNPGVAVNPKVSAELLTLLLRQGDNVVIRAWGAWGEDACYALGARFRDQRDLEGLTQSAPAYPEP